MPSFFSVEPNEWTRSILKRGFHPAVLLFSDERPRQVISCHSFFVDSVAVRRKNIIFYRHCNSSHTYTQPVACGSSLFLYLFMTDALFLRVYLFCACLAPTVVVVVVVVFACCFRLSVCLFICLPFCLSICVCLSVGSEQ